MVSIGDIIEGVVEIAGDYGLYAAVDGDVYLIALHELSWYRLRSSTDVADVGDRIKFMVIKLEDPDGSPRRLGSVKRAFPEQNPWRDPNAYAVGTKFSGEICNVMQYGAWLKHPAGADGLLHADSYPANTSLKIGDVLDVVIAECDIESKQFRVNVVTKNSE